MTKRLAVARLSLEVNSFSPVPTTIAEYSRCEWYAGEEALRRYTGTRTEMGAVAEHARRHPDWQVTVLRAASAPPGGPMDDSLFEAFRDEVVQGLKAGRWDAVYLSLHGATATPTRPDPEIELLQGVRAAVGAATPVGASFDMHANLGEPVIELVDALAGYKTLPHVDMYETAWRALEMLAAIAAGRLRPARALVRPGLILHSFNMRTTDGPMKEIEDIARSRENGRVVDVSAFGGFPWADSPFTGASVTALSDGDEGAAREAAEAVAQAMRQRAQRFAVSLPGPEEGLRRALAMPAGTIAVLECADNTYSGGIADTPGLFQALVTLAPPVPAVFAYFCNPDLVAKAHAEGVGARLSCDLGAMVTGLFGGSVPIEAEILRLTGGEFVNKGPMETGVKVTMGRSAVLRVRGRLDVIVTETRTPVNDPAYFEIHGIELSGVRLLCVKAKNHFRAGLGPFCAGFVEVDTPGPAATDLATLPFRYARLSDWVSGRRSGA